MVGYPVEYNMHALRMDLTKADTLEGLPENLDAVFYIVTPARETLRHTSLITPTTSVATSGEEDSG